MIYAFNFTGERDKKLSDLMCKTLRKYCQNLGGIEVEFTTGQLFMGQPYGNGAGWQPSLYKLDRLKRLVEKYKPTVNDFVLSVDSDVVFCNSQVFKYINPSYGIIGIQNKGPVTKTAIGDIRHMSGCSIYIRGDIATKMADFSEYQLEEIRKEFKAFTISENEDILLSYLAYKCGAEPFDLPDWLYNGEFENTLLNGWQLRSFYHLNYAIDRFMGVRCTGKWDFPEILQQKRITL